MTSFELKSRQHYSFFMSINTRWMDNDTYGHVNNVAYYSYFDTLVNSYLIECAKFDIHQDKVVGFVVASSCDYYSPISFPDRIEAALRINALGNRSVEYGVAIFKQGEPTASASGCFTHVFVDRELGRSVSIPEHIRDVLEKTNEI